MAARHRPRANQFFELGVRGRKTGLQSKANVRRDSDGLANVDDFFDSDEDARTAVEQEPRGQRAVVETSYRNPQQERDSESEEELKFEEPVVYEKLPRHLPPASQRNRVNREEKRRARMRVRPGRSFEEPRHAGYEDDEEEEDVEEENYHPAREPQDRSRLYEEEVEERGFLPTRPLVRTPVVRGEQRSRDFVIPQNEQEYFEEERDIRYSPSRQKMDSRRYSTKPVYAPMQHEQDDGDVYYEQMPSRSRPQSSRKPREEPLYQRDQQDYPEYASPKGARRKSYYPPVEREEVEEYENRHPLPVQRRNSVAPGYSQEDYEELVSQPAQYHSKAVASPRYPDEEQVPPRSRAMTPVKARKSSTEDTYRRVIVQSAVKRSAPPSASRALANVDRSLYRVEDSHTQSPGLRSPIKKVTVPSPAQPVEYQDTYEPADYDDNVGYDDQALPSHHEEPSPVPQRKSVSKVAKPKKEKKKVPKEPKEPREPRDAVAPRKRNIFPSVTDFKPEEDQDDENGVRKSKRTKIAPLQYWKNEKIVYGRRESGYCPVPVMKGILRVEDDSGDEKPLKKKSSKTKKTEPIHVAETELPVISYLNGEEETQKIVVTPEMLDPRTVGAGDYRFQKVFSEGDFLASGVLYLPKGAHKPNKNSNASAMIFVVMAGQVEVQIHKAVFTVGAGAQFFVPRGNQYRIENTGTREARLFFCHGKEISVSADDT